MKPFMIATALAMLATPAYAYSKKDDIKYCKIFVRCMQKANNPVFDERKIHACVNELRKIKDLHCGVD